MRVKVWNDNPNADWTEEFKGDKIFIKSGSFIEMEFYDGHEFKGQFSPIKIRPDETQDPKSFKMIRVEKIIDNHEDGEIEVQTTFPCNLCKKSFNSEDALLKHSERAHAGQEIVDETAESAMPKRKPGRPKKMDEANA